MLQTSKPSLTSEKTTWTASKEYSKNSFTSAKALDLYGAQLVAIDGTKFKAVNSRSNNLNEKTVALRLKQTEEKIAEYLKEMDQNDTADSAEDESVNNR